jgi:hypothetical protein
MLHNTEGNTMSGLIRVAAALAVLVLYNSFATAATPGFTWGTYIGGDGKPYTYPKWDKQGLTGNVTWNGASGGTYVIPAGWLIKTIVMTVEIPDPAMSGGWVQLFQSTGASIKQIANDDGSITLQASDPAVNSNPPVPLSQIASGSKYRATWIVTLKPATGNGATKDVTYGPYPGTADPH